MIVSVPAAVIVPPKLSFCAAVIVTDAPSASVRLLAVNAVPAPTPAASTLLISAPSDSLIVSAATVVNVPVAVRPATSIMSAPLPVSTSRSSSLSKIVVPPPSAKTYLPILAFAVTAPAFDKVITASPPSLTVPSNAF